MNYNIIQNPCLEEFTNSQKILEVNHCDAEYKANAKQLYEMYWVQRKLGVCQVGVSKHRDGMNKGLRLKKVGDKERIYETKSRRDLENKKK